jgi:DNA-binding NtrC family response regulator
MSPPPIPRAREPYQTDLSRRISELSLRRWGARRAVTMVGHDTVLADAQRDLVRFAQAESPVLVTGETGTGKELFARALYLLCARASKPFVCVNCAQYSEGQLLASELFGHKRGSFTGAVADQRGIFENANGGVVFLDEIAEMSLDAQAMLLRTLSEGEVLPVGESDARQVDVRTIAATSRNLREMIAEGRFRKDLFYRLRFLQIAIPPLRDRGADWRLICAHHLEHLSRQRGTTKHLSDASLARLDTYPWPGNVRELQSVVETAYCFADGTVIEPEHFEHLLEWPESTTPAVSPAPARRPSAFLNDELPPSQASDATRFARMTTGRETFWDVVHFPFLDREISRSEVRAVIDRGLRTTRGSYKNLLPLFQVDDHDYSKFMDFLRHHRLKPDHPEITGSMAPA